MKRFKPVTEEATEDHQIPKKKYCDKAFKKQLVKSLQANSGEPDNLEKIQSNRQLMKHPPERIIEYVNTVSADLQKQIDESITDPDSKAIIKLANLMPVINNQKLSELPLVMKLKSASENYVEMHATNNVDFMSLNATLYQMVSGLPDTVVLNDETKTVLYDTYRMLMEQVKRDATPEFLDELRSQICAGYTESAHPEIANISKLFHDKSLNPFNFPFEYLLNGTLPANSEKPDPKNEVAKNKWNSTTTKIEETLPEKQSNVKK